MGKRVLKRAGTGKNDKKKAGTMPAFLLPPFIRPIVPQASDKQRNKEQRAENCRAETRQRAQVKPSDKEGKRAGRAPPPLF